MHERARRDGEGGNAGMGRSRREGTVVVHNNWIVGKHNKIQRFKNAGLWLEGTEHAPREV